MPIFQGWGMTETSPLAALSVPPKRGDGRSSDPVLARSPGRILPGVELRIVDDGGREQPWDGKAEGEIEVRGPWVTASYYGDPAPEKFRDGWLRTGDVGVVERSGFIRITDRAKDVIKSGGEWISSVALENLVMAHPAVAEAAVIGVPDEQMGRAAAGVRGPQVGPIGRSRGAVRAPRAARLPSGGCPSAGPSSTRCPRPASVNSTRKCCAAATPTGSCGSRKADLRQFTALIFVSGVLSSNDGVEPAVVPGP